MFAVLTSLFFSMESLALDENTGFAKRGNIKQSSQNPCLCRGVALPWFSLNLAVG